MTLWIDVTDVPVKRRLPLRKAARRAQARVLVRPGDAHPKPDDLTCRDGRVWDDGKVVASWFTIDTPADQESAASADGTVVVEARDWRVIPFENLIAARRDRPGTLLAVARDPEEASLLLATLEVGVDGIVLRAKGAEDIVRVAEAMALRPQRPSGPGAVAGVRGATGDGSRTDAAGAAPVLLTEARVVAIAEAGVGDRVCVDTTTLLAPGEGLLVGSTAAQMCLVEAEVHASGYVAPRPFRVNAGAVHAYVLGPAGRTQYLSELASGAQVMAVDRTGATRLVTVGRCKVERRPHVLVRWRCGRAEGSMVLQTAETVRLVKPDGSIAVTALAEGDTILVHAGDAARHFGMPVDARVEER